MGGDAFQERKRNIYSQVANLLLLLQQVIHGAFNFQVLGEYDLWL